MESQRSIAVIGTGAVGRALGERLSAVGLHFTYGSQEPSRHESLPGPVVDVATAIERSAIVMLAVPASAATEALRVGVIRPDHIIVDITNPLRWDEGPVWDPPAPGSVSMELARAYPAARTVKGFNHFGAEIQSQPSSATGPADAFFASDHEEAKTEVMSLAERLGFNPVDAGGLRNAALLENLAVLWIHLSSIGGMGRHFSFKTVTHQ